MPIANFTVGHDVSVDIISGTTGQVISLPANTGFTAEATTQQIASRPLSGPPVFGEMPDGWSGTIDFDRTDIRIDAFFAAREAAYYKGQNIINDAIVQTIRERDGTITQYRFVNVALKFSQGGQWKAQDKVAQNIAWKASTRVQVL